MGKAQDILDFIEKVKDLLLYYETSETYNMAGVMSGLPSICDDDVDMFLAECFSRSLHDCLILGAVRYGRIEQMLSFEALNLDQHKSGQFWTDLIRFLCSEDRPLCVIKLFTHDTMFQKLLEACARPDDAFSHVLFECLLSLLMELGLSQQFKLLVNDDRKSIRQVLMDRLVKKGKLMSLVYLNCRSRLHPGYFCNINPDHKGCLTVAHEAGLFLDSIPDRDFEMEPIFGTPIGTAVFFNQPDLVQILYSTGSVTNRQLFQLSRHPMLVQKSKASPVRQDAQPSPSPDKFPSQNDGYAARQIRSFLLKKASQPRSLQSLCLREVSTLVGWGHVKEANVDQLEIPQTLKNDLKSKGIIAQ